MKLLHPELIYIIVDFLQVDELLNFCLTSRDWVDPCQRRLFHSVSLESPAVLDLFLSTARAHPRLCAYPRDLALDMGHPFSSPDIENVIYDSRVALGDLTLGELVGLLPNLRALDVMAMIWRPLGRADVDTFRFLAAAAGLTSLSLTCCIFASFVDLTHILRRCPRLEVLNLYNVQYLLYATQGLEVPARPLRLRSLRADESYHELFRWPLACGVDLSGIATLDVMELFVDEEGIAEVGAVVSSLPALVDLRIGFTNVPVEHYRGGELVLDPGVHLQPSTLLRRLRVGSALSPCILAAILLQRSTTAELEELVIDLGQAKKAQYDWRALDETLARDQFSRLKDVMVLLREDMEYPSEDTIQDSLSMLRRRSRLSVVRY